MTDALWYLCGKLAGAFALGADIPIKAIPVIIDFFNYAGGGYGCSYVQGVPFNGKRGEFGDVIEGSTVVTVLFYECSETTDYTIELQQIGWMGGLIQRVYCVSHTYTVCFRAYW